MVDENGLNYINIMYKWKLWKIKIRIIIMKVFVNFVFVNILNKW